MKLLTAKVQNFGSYEDLEFSYNDLGLALIQGSTGAGKSTIQDIPSWILYGVTSKNGTVEEVRNWNNLDKSTIGVLSLEAKGAKLEVTRIRGKQHENDLYWTEDNILHRGKDLTETQQLLEKRLGVSCDLYLIAASFNEFSPTATFFTDKAKTRRELFEKLANLDLPILLAKRTTDAKKTTKNNISELDKKLQSFVGAFDHIKSSIESTSIAENRWNAQNAKNLETIQHKAKTHQADWEANIENIRKHKELWDETHQTACQVAERKHSQLYMNLAQVEEKNCSHCGAPNEQHRNLTRELNRALNELSSVKRQTNPHEFLLQHAMKPAQNPWHQAYEEALKALNPFTPQLVNLHEELHEKKFTISELEAKLDDQRRRLDLLNRLYDLSFSLRSKLLTKAIQEVEKNTNAYLELYFDAELKISLEQVDGDSLEVNVFKGEKACVYRQLSKGQRQLLKITTVIAVMQLAANNAGVWFSVRMFDEALDGLDAELKVKAFSLFQSLAMGFDTILLIDHAEEFKSMFERRFSVSLFEDASTIVEV